MLTNSFPILVFHRISFSAAHSAIAGGNSYKALPIHHQLSWLKSLGWKGASISKVLSLAPSDRGRMFAITFDDGYLDTFEQALPLLLELNFTATCYLPSLMIGKLNQWDVDNGAAPIPLMTGSQASEWVARGMEIGSHGRRHSNLNLIAPEAMWEEIYQSKVDLENHLGCGISSFAYPYGQYSQSAASLVREAGYASAVTMKPGWFKPSNSVFELPRVPGREDESLIRSLIRSTFDVYSIRSYFSLNSTHKSDI